MELRKDKTKVTLDLTHSEALVFSDWLFQFNKKEDLSSFQDQAEQRILFDLEAVLERAIGEIFAGNYKDVLSRARDEIRDKDEPN